MRYFFVKNLLLNIIASILCVTWLFVAGYGLYIWGLKRYVYPLKERETVFYYADYYEIDKALVYAVIKAESGFNEHSESHKGAKGLMQITEPTGRYIADKMGVERYDLMDKETNVNFGCFYIRYLMDKFGDKETALTAYNAGEGKVRIWLMNKEYSDDGKSLKKIPYRESREYIDKIKENFSKYNKLYGNLLDKS